MYDHIFSKLSSSSCHHHRKFLEKLRIPRERLLKYHGELDEEGKPNEDDFQQKLSHLLMSCNIDFCTNI